MIALPSCSDLAGRPSQLTYAYLEADRRLRSNKISAVYRSLLRG